jgi:CarboxypepD_reg-like domain
MQRDGKESSARSASKWRGRHSAINRGLMTLPKGLLALLFILFYSLTFAQQKIIQGILVDKATQEPVPYVHVFQTSTSYGTISDLNGEFTLVVNPAKADSLRFSCIGYETQRIALKNFLDKRMRIELAEDRVLLPSFTVHELSAKEFIKKCVTRIPVNYSSAKTSKSAFYWNSAQHAKNYTDFFEAYLQLNNKSKLISYDSVVRSIHDRFNHITLFDSLTDILNFDVINQGSMFVNPDNIDDWKFEYLYSSEHPDGSFVIIEANMIQSSFNSVKKKESNSLRIYVNASSFAITRIDFSYAWQEGTRHYWKDDVQFFLSKLDGTVEYQKSKNTKYDLSYLFIGTEFSFMKRYNPALLRKAFINHELVVLPNGKSSVKPVIRWGDYLQASDRIQGGN